MATESLPVPSHRPAQTSDDGQIMRRTAVVALIAIPIFVAFWVGLVALAVSFTSVGYGPALAMAAGVGVLAGLFWASWYGFVAFSHHEEADRRASRSQQGARTRAR